MSRQVLYVAAPLRPTGQELAAAPQYTVLPGTGEYDPDVRVPFSEVEILRMALRANLDRAMRWLAWLRRSFPETTFIAPWIAAVLAGADDTDPAQREAGIADQIAVIERCDGIVLCGGRISEGMRREMEWGSRSARGPGREIFAVYDLSVWGSEPPDGQWLGGQACPAPWSKWGGCFRL